MQVMSPESVFYKQQINRRGARVDAGRALEESCLVTKVA